MFYLKPVLMMPGTVLEQKICTPLSAAPGRTETLIYKMAPTWGKNFHKTTTTKTNKIKQKTDKSLKKDSKNKRTEPSRLSVSGKNSNN